MLWFSINFFPISWSINCSIDSLINLPLVLILFTHIEVLNSLVGVLLLVYYKFLMKFLFFYGVFRPTDMGMSSLSVKTYLAFMPNEQRGVFSVTHTYCLKSHPFVWPSPSIHYMLPNVWHGSCHYLFLRLRYIATGYRTPISCMQWERSTNWANGANSTNNHKLNDGLTNLVCYQIHFTNKYASLELREGSVCDLNQSTAHCSRQNYKYLM